MFYDQIVNENIDSLLLFADKHELVSRSKRKEYLTEIEQIKLKKHQDKLNEINQQVINYTYKI